MFEILHKVKVRLREWATRHADGPHAKGWLMVLSFAEASFFPIPPDIFLAAVITAQKDKKWLYYSVITTLASVAGGAFGYFIGIWFFDSIGQFLISFYGLEDSIYKVKDFFVDNAFWAIFISGFSPIPYKVFTISAGFFNINFIIFITASAISRLLRFLPVGYIVNVFGEEIGKFVFRYFNVLTVLIAISIVLLIVFI